MVLRQFPNFLLKFSISCIFSSSSFSSCNSSAGCNCSSCNCCTIVGQVLKNFHFLRTFSHAVDVLSMFCFGVTFIFVLVFYSVSNLGFGTSCIITLKCQHIISFVFAHCRCFAKFGTIVQFKKREKQQWRSLTFSEVTGFQPATLLKVTLLHVCFSHFLNCTNGTKSRNTSLVSLIVHGGRWLQLRFLSCQCRFESTLSFQ